MEVYRITDRSEEEVASRLFYVGTVGVHVLRSSNDGIEVRLLRFGPGSRSRPRDVTSSSSTSARSTTTSCGT
jgi:hypothetical protein